jgi:hypothetical protein
MVRLSIPLFVWSHDRHSDRLSPLSLRICHQGLRDGVRAKFSISLVPLARMRPRRQRSHRSRFGTADLHHVAAVHTVRGHKQRLPADIAGDRRGHVKNFPRRSVKLGIRATQREAQMDDDIRTHSADPETSGSRTEVRSTLSAGGGRDSKIQLRDVSPPPLAWRLRSGNA